MKKRKVLFLLSCLIAAAAVAEIRNPLFTHLYSADPSAHVFNDTLWVYPSHDRDDALSFSMEDYHVFSTTDMEHWQDHGVIFNPLAQTTWAKKAAWAPDCVYRNGKYYLYYPTDQRHIGVAVSDRPDGPFVDPLGHPLLSIDSPGVVCNRDFIDPAVMIDDDGQAYLYVGQNTVCCIRLNEDMISYDGEVHIIEGVHEFFEAVWVHKRDGIYYMSYSDGPFFGHEPQISYCTSRSPLGPFVYQGVILGPVNSGTNHHSIVSYKGQDYLFYHTADMSRTMHPDFHCGVRRSVCCDSLYYDADGKILPVKPTLAPDRLLVLGDDDSRQALQTLIDRCHRAGGGVVVVPQGVHQMDGPLELKSHVRLHLRDSATLLFTSDPDAYLPVVLTRWEGTELYGRSSMIHAQGQTDVIITGEGSATIDANGGVMARWGMPGGRADFEENVHGTHGETPETPDVSRLRQMGDDLTPVSERVFGKGTRLRPCAIEFNECTRVRIEGVTLKNSPFWCIHPLYCQDVVVRGVTIESGFPNNDGCDPESCSNVLIEDCTFRTGDDAVAIKSGRDADGRRVNRPSENITIRNCRFYSKCNGLCIGSEMSGGVRNVRMCNIEIGDVKNALLFKSNLDRGGFIEDVTVDSIRIGHVSGAVLRFETNYFGYRGGHYPARYQHFDIRNVHAQSADSFAIYYDGNTEAPITDIQVENFKVDVARHPHYLFHTDACRFVNCEVNGQLLPETLPHDTEPQQCDVW